jgi:hypothetical protein
MFESQIDQTVANEIIMLSLRALLPRSNPRNKRNEALIDNGKVTGTPNQPKTPIQT